jgi:hypothetical protein
MTAPAAVVERKDEIRALLRCDYVRSMRWCVRWFGEQGRGMCFSLGPEGIL